jgi:hypothetical protein
MLGITKEKRDGRDLDLGLVLVEAELSASREGGVLKDTPVPLLFCPSTPLVHAILKPGMITVPGILHVKN